MQLDAQLAGSGARAALLRDSLQWSERLNKDVSGVLDAYTARLADLQLAVAPVTQRTQVRLRWCSACLPRCRARRRSEQGGRARQALQAARINIRKARERAEEVLGHVDTARQVRRSGRAPHPRRSPVLSAAGRAGRGAHPRRPPARPGQLPARAAAPGDGHHLPVAAQVRRAAPWWSQRLARHPGPWLPGMCVSMLPGARSLATAEGALSSATALRADALRLALEDFTATLRQHSSGAAPPMIAAGSESATSSPSRGGRETPQAGAHPARGPGRRRRAAAAVPARVR